MDTMKIIYLLFLALVSLTTNAQNFPYRSYEPFISSNAEETNCMFFDKEGLMWIGTNAGLKSYDGYTTKTYKSDAFSPGILPNNNIRTIVEDHNDCLWLGTRNGLVRMNKRTGKFKTFYLPKENQRIIYHLYISKDGTLWIGTDDGLSYFDATKETFHCYDRSNSWLVSSNGEKTRMPICSVKSILEDDNGDLLVGTWATGLLRLKKGSHTFLQYPNINKHNSAYSLFFDYRHRLWIGTWGYGVVCIDNPSDMKHPVMHQYPYQPRYFDTFYQVVEDPITHTLWAGTREGLCILDENNPHAQWQQYIQIKETSLAFNNSIATDRHGNIWLNTLNNGIIQVNTNTSPFKIWDLKVQNNFNVNSISSIFTADGKCFWLGLSPYGIALYNRESQSTLYNRDIPGFENIKDFVLSTSITDIKQRYNGEIWFANNSFGILVKKPSAPTILLNTQAVSYLRDNFVNTLFEDKSHVMWIGQRTGLSIVYPDNTGTALTLRDAKYDFSSCDVHHITQDKAGNIWLATDNEGIIRISGDARKPKTLVYKQYNPNHANFAIDDAIACHEDRLGRLWAISNSGGLFLYNKEKDCFEPKNRAYYLQGSRMLAINEDSYGNLWLTTDKALIQLVWGGKATAPQEATYFGKEDGLGEIKFSANSTFRFGKELYFGGRRSFFSFIPSREMVKSSKNLNRLIITDLAIDDVPFSELDSTSKAGISTETPTFTRFIKIPSSIKKFSVDFALLTYGNAQKNTYAYKLDGYDDDWKYISGDIHRATFQNLPSGTYHLHVKANDSYGHWLEMPYTIRIQVLPPWYASRLAYMLYIILFILGIFATTQWYKRYLKTKNRLQMGVILTNITHELLTPLTIISATIYKLREHAPQFMDDYEIMDNNIDRTTRLLRQILEVRKSQAGQLKLRVSKGNLTAFLLKACENIRPMATRQGITLEVHVPKSPYLTWFDTDKLDKVLYNLLSNAIKYNKKNGSITVSLSADKENAILQISDTGIGMNNEKLKNLYTRFFDGDYRKQNMPGTGIGLSLTHDLIKLHHGSIDCKSTEGEGTTFTITLPTRKKDYTAEEIDNDHISSKEQDYQAIKEANEVSTSTNEPDRATESPLRPRISEDAKTLLVVEDNEEVLNLLVEMLGKKYRIITAKNGKQALNIIYKEGLDLVISDIMMPIMDGIELTQQIKSNKQFWQLPVILLSAKNKDEDKTEGYNNGADAYITKPFKFEELEARIHALLTNREKIKEKFTKDSTPLISAENDIKGDDSHYSNPDIEFVRRVKELFLEHLTDSEYNREKLATDMAVSSTTLYNKVKATTGQTVVSYLTTIRLEEAKRIIKTEPEVAMGEVSLRIGFNSPKYFSKCFKKEYGIYPKDYAKEVKSKIYS